MQLATMLRRQGLFPAIDAASYSRRPARNCPDDVTTCHWAPLLATVRRQVHIPETNAEGQEVIKTGKLWLVDLAGSENISRCVFARLYFIAMLCQT